MEQAEESADANFDIRSEVSVTRIRAGNLEDNQVAASHEDDRPTSEESRASSQAPRPEMCLESPADDISHGPLSQEISAEMESLMDLGSADGDFSTTSLQEASAEMDMEETTKFARKPSLKKKSSKLTKKNSQDCIDDSDEWGALFHEDEGQEKGQHIVIRKAPSKKSFRRKVCVFSFFACTFLQKGFLQGV